MFVLLFDVLKIISQVLFFRLVWKLKYKTIELSESVTQLCLFLSAMNWFHMGKFAGSRDENVTTSSLQKEKLIFLWTLFIFQNCLASALSKFTNFNPPTNELYSTKISVYFVQNEFSYVGPGLLDVVKANTSWHHTSFSCFGQFSRIVEKYVV